MDSKHSSTGEAVYNELVKFIASTVTDRLVSNGINTTVDQMIKLVTEPPREKYGDLSLPLMRFISKISNASALVEEIISSIKSHKLVRDVVYTNGYLNIFIDEAELARQYLPIILEKGLPRIDVGASKRIVVEHTSANPVHPLHIGHARNSILGDTLSRLLSATGFLVQRRFYINDMGRQVAVLVFGVKNLGRELDELLSKRNAKSDHLLGYIYAVTHTLVDVINLKKSIEEGKENAEKAKDELTELMGVLAELKNEDPELFNQLIAVITRYDDPESEIQKLMKRYEEEDQEVSRLFKKVVELCVDGFRETLSKIGVDFDVWDWESNVVRESWVLKILEKARQTPYFTIYKGAEAIDFSEFYKDPDLVKLFNLPKAFKIPPMILRRSDGTTLYTTRDVAYSLKKFREYNADKVINVIAAEQRLEQLQVRLSLYALGYKREAMNLIHYAYEMVNMPGVKMSGRRGRYITLDSLLEEAIARAREEIRKRRTGLSKEEEDEISKAIGVGALRYALVSVEADKPLVFDWDKVLDFEKSSAPYLQYTYVRALNILRKLGEEIRQDKIDYQASKEPLRRKLLITTAKYTYILEKAAAELKPELLVDYITSLADIFNTWYPKDPVIKEANEGARYYKASLVYAIKTTIEHVLGILGIPLLEKM